jgi:hypothetical protein
VASAVAVSSLLNSIGGLVSAVNLGAMALFLACMAAAVVISERLRRRLFAGSDNVLGRLIGGSMRIAEVLTAEEMLNRVEFL